MEAAGWGLAGAAIELGAGYGWRVSVLAGPGNNGGDGWVAARRLAGSGCHVTVHQLGEPTTAVARRARDRALPVVNVAPVSEIGRPRLVIDALFGSGARAGLPDVVKPWIELDVPVVAAHVPSGIDAGTGVAAGEAFSAERTVAFHALSPGHLLGDGPDYCGHVTVTDIGLIGGDPEFLVAEKIDALRPTRPRTGHKWSVGSVLVVGGSPGMLGAAVMAAQSALHFGAGAVGLAVPDELTEPATQLAPEILVYRQSEIPDRFDVVVAGPGMGEHTEALGSILRSDRPLVLDADGVTGVSRDDLAKRTAPTIITPHAGEFVNLAGVAPSLAVANQLASDLGIIVLMKGAPTFVCDGEVPVCIRSNGRELASIGTGDVLAGMTGALIARGLEPCDAGVSAAYWHGVAAAELASRTSVTAPGLVELIGRFAGTLP